MVLWIVAIGVVSAVAGLIIGTFIQRIQRNAAEHSAAKIRSNAEKEAEHVLREARVSAKEKINKMREECEAELKERRKEQTAAERRLAQRGETLDRRADTMDAKLKNIEKQESDIAALRERLSGKEQELSKSISRQIDELERIAGMSREEARTILLEKLQNEVKNESGLLVRGILEEARERSEKEARRILTYAMQRYASDCTY